MKHQMQRNLQHPTKTKPPSKINIKQQGANILHPLLDYGHLFATSSHKLIN
jgi:hypothetical protein